MPTFKVDIPVESYKRLAEIAVTERRPIPWQAEMLLIAAIDQRTERMAMDRSDDRNEAVLRALLSVFNPDGGWERIPYPDVLHQLQGCLTDAVPMTPTKQPPDPPAVDQEQAAREALGRLDPHAEDSKLGYAEVLHRDLGIVDRELFRWTSSTVQPPGPSGEIAVAGSSAARSGG